MFQFHSMVCSSQGGAEEVERGMRSWKAQVTLASNRYCTAKRHLLTFYLSICSHLHLFHNPCIAGQPELRRWVRKGLCSVGKAFLLQTVLTVDRYIIYFSLWVEITPRDHFFTFPTPPGLQHLHSWVITCTYLYTRLDLEKSGAV